MRRSALVAAVAAGAVMVGAESATAALFCVNKPPCTGGTQVASLKAAADAANAAGGPDRIEIGAGSYPFVDEAFLSGAAGVTIVGAGRGQTVLQGGGAGTRVLWTSHADTLVTDLTVALAAADSVDGIRMDGGRLERVDVTGDAGGGSTAIALRDGADASDVRALIRSDTVAANRAMTIEPNTQLIEVDRVELRAFYAYYHSAPGPSVLRRARLAGRHTLFARNQANVDADGVVAQITADGEAVTATQQSTANTGDTVVSLRHATLIGNGSSNQIAYQVINSSNGGGPRESRIVARDVLVSGIEIDAEMFTSNEGRTRLDTAYSTARRAPVDTFGPVGSHFVIDGPGLIAPPADPGFNADFSLKPSSPYVDVGEPGGISGSQSPVDLLGAPRIADGNADGTARRDVGAFEVQPPPPPAPPAGSAPPVTTAPPPPVVRPPLARLPLLRLAFPSSLRLDRRGRLSLPVSCPRGGGPCAGRIVVATAAAIIAQRRRKRFVTIGSTSYRVAAGRTARLVIRVSARNRALIRRRGRLRLIARATASDGGATRKPFTVRPARRRR